MDGEIEENPAGSAGYYAEQGKKTLKPLKNWFFSPLLRRGVGGEALARSLLNLTLYSVWQQSKITNPRKMAVRRPTARTSTLQVRKSFRVKGKWIGITLYREDTFIQNKSILYSKMKSIEKGALKLPIPLNKIANSSFVFTVLKTGKIKFDFSDQ